MNSLRFWISSARGCQFAVLWPKHQSRLRRRPFLMTDSSSCSDAGREAVREYWTRQRTIVSPHVEPVSFHRTADGAIIAEVRQSVRDLEGRPLQGQTHRFKEKTIGHVFPLREGKVGRFDIQDAP